MCVCSTCKNSEVLFENCSEENIRKQSDIENEIKDIMGYWV